MIEADAPSEELVPARSGPRPRTTATNPHKQLDQHPPSGVIAELARECFALQHVVERPSMISVSGARALVLSKEAARGPREAFMIGREFAHIHPLPDGSLHLMLPTPMVDEVIEQEWGELHPMAEMGYIPRTAVMVYAPRDTTEVSVVMDIVRESYRFALGEASGD